MKTQRTPLTPEQRALVEKNLGLAQHLAAAAARRSGGALTVDDALSGAYEGLTLAANSFDPNRAAVREDGTRDYEGAFSGYARTRINGEILDIQRRRDHVPKGQRALYKKIVALGYGAGRSAEEVSDLTGKSVEEVRRVSAAVSASPVPLPEPEAFHQAGSTSLDETAAASRIQQAFVAAFEALPQTTQLVVALRYYSGLSLTDIAVTLETSVSRVQALHTEASDALYAVMRAEAR